VTRRDILRTVALSFLPTCVKGQARVRHEVYGAGPTLILGSPVTLSSPESLRTGYLSRLTDTYRVVLMDYPRLEEDASSFTPNRVSDDMLAVADAVGADRFAWFGFSWGAVVGLQLAARTNRLTALICGGWPPLGAPYSETLSVTESLAARIPEGQMMVTYYRALQNWPEREMLSKLTLPRMTFAGTNDIVGLPGGKAAIGPVIAQHRDELERLGWTVGTVDGFGHELVGRPEIVVPLIREFLDPVLLSR
jgi:hypothetical protein